MSDRIAIDAAAAEKEEEEGRKRKRSSKRGESFMHRPTRGSRLRARKQVR